MYFRIAIIIASIAASLIFSFIGLLLLQPEWLFSRIRSRSPQVLYAVDTQAKVVALTIDDGPDAVTTPKILDILDTYNARATFFLITDRIPGNESLVERIVDEGHEIGNHLTEDQPSINLSVEDFERQLIEADELLSGFGDVIWMRPGSGWYNDAMLKVVENHGYQCALGSVYPYDPQVGSAWFSTHYVLWKIKPGEIIVLHDYHSRGQRTARALETILPSLVQQGYQVVTLTELTQWEEEPAKETVKNVDGK
jgi:peptidoglycan/xylan/chitin deacetylase (PgdA/CDA1 family)